MVSANRGKSQKGVAMKSIGYFGCMPLYAQVLPFQREIRKGFVEHIPDPRMQRMMSSSEWSEKGKSHGVLHEGNSNSGVIKIHIEFK